MLKTDEGFSRSVEEAVAEIELTTDAEIVVVVAPRSGSYADVALLTGVALAWLLLVFVLYSPLSFSGDWLPIELPLFGALAAWAAHRSPWLLRHLTHRRRRRAQVQDAAAQAFHEEAVVGTKGRTGMLVYVSVLEGEVELIPDSGIQARVPGGAWNALRWGQDGVVDTTTQLTDGLRAMGVILAQAVPPTGDNPNEISDAPRIRS